MWVSDSTSNQAAQRQRRHAAEERQRVDRAANEMAVRQDGVARQAGEPPAREDVRRFSALMQARGNSQQAPTQTPSRDSADAPVATTAGETPPSMPMTIADRFRALFQRTADGQPQSQSSAQGELGAEEASTPASSQQAGSKPDGAPVGKATAGTHPTSRANESRADTTAPEGDEPAKPALADASKIADGDGRRAQGTRAPTTSTKKDDSAADTAQHAAQQVARGEVQTPPVARKARGDETAEGDADALSRPTNPLAPLSMTPSDMAPPQQRTPDAPQQMAATAGMVAPALAELIQKHVKQMLVTDTRGGGARSRELLLRMESDVLPGTDLWLTRTDKGWRMRADVRSRDAYDTLLANQDDLIQRFADGALGELSIEPVFHG
jgi:hypothetical protein